MIASSDNYQSKLNCQENFFICDNLLKNHGHHEQQHYSVNSLRRLNSDSFKNNKNENFYFDNNISIIQPELKRVKVNLDSITSNFCSKINKSSNIINVAEINCSNNSKSSIKQLIYRKINESKIAVNTKIENQLVGDENNKNTAKKTSKCNLFNPYLIQHDEYKVQQVNQEELISNFQDSTKTRIYFYEKELKSTERDMNSTSTNQDLAYENLTYLSSDEDDIDNLKLGQDTTTTTIITNTNTINITSASLLGQDILKKTTLKSIKRKDKLKKNSNFEITISNKSLAKSMPDLSADPTKLEITKNNQKSQESISNNEYEKILRKQFRNQALSRSLRRAKCVYYRNIRSKSLEDLTSEERANYLMKAAANLEKLRAKALSKLSINSCSSTNSNAVSITSSYIRDLSDWSPEFSTNESDSTDDELLDDFDWDANLSLSQIDLDDCESEDNSSSSCDNEDTYEIDLDKNKTLDLKIRDEINESLRIPDKKNKIEFIEKMMNEIMFKMINVLHIDLSCLTNAESYDLIKDVKYTRIRNEDIEYHNNCSICSLEYELDDEVASIDCNHTFHKFCLNFWLAKVNRCPACCCQRKSISHRETLL